MHRTSWPARSRAPAGECHMQRLVPEFIGGHQAGRARVHGSGPHRRRRRTAGPVRVIGPSGPIGRHRHAAVTADGTVRSDGAGGTTTQERGGVGTVGDADVEQRLGPSEGGLDVGRRRSPGEDESEIAVAVGHRYHRSARRNGDLDIGDAG